MKKRTGPKVETMVSAERVRLFKLIAPNPIPGATPAKLGRLLDNFDRGNLRECVLLWQKILDRDDQAKPCDSKRRRNVTGLEYEILPEDDSPEAANHKEALEAFYRGLTCVHGMNLNERGGTRLAFRLMMSAVGMKWAPFEIVWQPSANGLTAELRFLPLHFFENTTGELRFLETDLAQTGTKLDDYFGPGGWMVVVGEGLMEATSAAWMYKTPAGLKSWVTFCEKFGIAPLHATTTAKKGDPEWDTMVAALTGYGEDLALLTSEGAKITPIAGPAGATLPQPLLVDRMDRAISRLWLGGDLATMSKEGAAVGSDAQSPEEEKLQADDAAMITDACQYYLDARVIEYRFGAGIAPKAYFKLKPPARMNVDRERATDEFLIKVGCGVGKKQLLARYGRAEPEAADDLATLPVAAPAFPFTSAANEAAGKGREKLFRAAALEKLDAAQRDALAPLAARLDEIAGIEDDTARAEALAKLERDLPAIYRAVLADPATAQAFEEILGTALVDGAAEAAAKHSSK